MIIEDLVMKYRETHDEETLKEIFEANKRIIDFFCKNNPDPDIYSVILEGLYYSILKFDLKYNKSFTMFTIENIKNFILNYYRKNNNINILYNNFLIAKMIIEKRFGTTLEKDFSLFDYILDYMIENKLIKAKDIELVKKKILIFLKNSYLEYMVGDMVDETELDHNIMEQITSEELRAKLDKLDYRTAEIIRLRYGIDCDPKKIQEIANCFKFSTSAVQKRLKKGLEELKKGMAI